MTNFCKLLETEIIGGADPHIVGIAADPAGRRFQFMYDKNANQVVCFPGRSGYDDPGYQDMQRFLSSVFINDK